MEEYDIERLRDDLIDYYGTASMIYCVAMADLVRVQSSSDSELIEIAINNGYNLEDYKVSYERKL